MAVVMQKLLLFWVGGIWILELLETHSDAITEYFLRKEEKRTKCCTWISQLKCYLVIHFCCWCWLQHNTLDLCIHVCHDQTYLKYSMCRQPKNLCRLVIIAKKIAIIWLKLNIHGESLESCPAVVKFDGVPKLNLWRIIVCHFSSNDYYLNFNCLSYIHWWYCGFISVICSKV